MRRGGSSMLLAAMLAAVLAFGGAGAAFADEGGQAADAASSSASSAAGASSVDSNDENVVEPSQRTDSSFVYDTTIGALMDSSALYDNQTVQITGEVVGDRIRDTSDDRYCWIAVESSSTQSTDTVSVRMTNEQANLIDTYGKYGVTGTTVRVRGTFFAECPQHDSASDVHATYVEVVQRGVAEKTTVDAIKFLPGILLVLIGAVLTGIFYYVRERMR